jgi:hypothetical protein
LTANFTGWIIDVLIFFRTNGSIFVQPIVVIDATRSDENYTQTQIKTFIAKWLGKFAGRELPPGAAQGSETKLYSLAYSCQFTHDAISLGNALKAQFFATITNAPGELVSLLKIEQYTTEQNLALLEKVIDNVINPQVAFPAGVMICRNGDTIVERGFTVFSTPYNADGRLVNTTLQIRGAYFSDLVMRLSLAITLTKRGDETLEEQLKKYESDLGFTIVFKNGKQRRPPADKYYAPAPINVTLAQICKDNNVSFYLRDNTLFFYTLDPKEAPAADFAHLFSMRHQVNGTKLMQPPTFSDYATMQTNTELHEPELFTRIGVFDDSGSTTLFSNLAKAPPYPGTKLNLYGFYVTSYTIADGRDVSVVRYVATNNWLLNYVKLDAILENKVYTNAIT